MKLKKMSNNIIKRYYLRNHKSILSIKVFQYHYITNRLYKNFNLTIEIINFYRNLLKYMINHQILLHHLQNKIKKVSLNIERKKIINNKNKGQQCVIVLKSIKNQ